MNLDWPPESQMPSVVLSGLMCRQVSARKGNTYLYSAGPDLSFHEGPEDRVSSGRGPSDVIPQRPMVTLPLPPNPDLSEGRGECSDLGPFSDVLLPPQTGPQTLPVGSGFLEL